MLLIKHTCTEKKRQNLSYKTNELVIMILIIILVVIVKTIFSDVTPGFHFHADRVRKNYPEAEEKGKIPLALSEMEAHEADPKSAWMFDFEKYGHCARIDIKPFILPKDFTVCYKVNHDFSDRFVLLSFLSTKSGNSLVDDFKNKTYREMKAEDGIVNLLHFFRRYGWSSVYTFVGKNDHFSTGGLSGFQYGWRRWEQWCIAFHLETGQGHPFVNGMDDGTKVPGQSWYKKQLEEANSKLKEKNLVTDVLVGCSPWEWSFGQITDIQMFDRFLTHDEMVGMTTCSGKKLTGNIINSNKDPHSLYGDWV